MTLYSLFVHVTIIFFILHFFLVFLVSCHNFFHFFFILEEGFWCFFSTLHLTFGCFVIFVLPFCASVHLFLHTLCLYELTSKVFPHNILKVCVCSFFFLGLLSNPNVPPAHFVDKFKL